MNQELKYYMNLSYRMEIVEDKDDSTKVSFLIIKNRTNNIAVSIIIIILLIKYFFITSPIKLYNK